VPATTEAASATIAAGGQGAVTTPVAVPNQKRDEIDPAATDDLTVAAAPQLSEEQSSTAIAAAVAAAPAAEVKPEPPKQDFTMGIQQTDAEREAEKRAQRAKRFGIVPDEEEIKKAERAKKFGEGAGAAVNIAGLDEALPERKKRGREGREQGGREAKRQTPDRRTEAPRRGEKNNNAAQKQALKQAAAPAPLKKVMKRVLDDPVEKAKAEARLKKFGPPTPAASS
jgi:SAP domain-containing ribonucleoprotein